MTTAIFTHPVCVAHDPGAGHPESPARLESVLAALRAAEFAGLSWREAPRAADEDLHRIHPPSYVARVLGAVPPMGRHALDPDTFLSPESGAAALHAAGAVCAAVDGVVRGESQNAFCAVRPPGHHAEATRAMGFCLFNNVAIGALHARAVHGLRRVAVVDFDVHHGNGTQHSFEHDADLFFASTHQGGIYPGTGLKSERGIGNVVNEPLPGGAGSREFRAAYSGSILPALEAFAPDMILISAGFDAHAADPLAGLELQTEDYGWVTAEILAVAAKCCGGRVVSTLEGGYDLAALAASAGAHARSLMAAPG